MTTEAEFRAKWEARVVEAMAKAIHEATGHDPDDWDYITERSRNGHRAIARAALAAYQGAMWMPMSEAPKDGAPDIIIALTGDHPAHVSTAYYQPIENDWWFSNTTPADGWSDPISEIYHNPITHCQPLPLPPTDEVK